MRGNCVATQAWCRGQSQDALSRHTRPGRRIADARANKASKERKTSARGGTVRPPAPEPTGHRRSVPLLHAAPNG